MFSTIFMVVLVVLLTADLITGKVTRTVERLIWRGCRRLVDDRSALLCARLGVTLILIVLLISSVTPHIIGIRRR
ncbi:hypothetical protein VI03_25215 [Burkholderia vietnamiensis]|nr:hypothetical protein VI03_25215 [Burkholderia vietnamiensis]